MTLRHNKQTTTELLIREIRVLFFIWSCLLLYITVSIKNVLSLRRSFSAFVAKLLVPPPKLRRHADGEVG